MHGHLSVGVLTTLEATHLFRFWSFPMCLMARIKEDLRGLTVDKTMLLMNPVITRLKMIPVISMGCLVGGFQNPISIFGQPINRWNIKRRWAKNWVLLSFINSTIPV